MAYRRVQPAKLDLHHGPVEGSGDSKECTGASAPGEGANPGAQSAFPQHEFEEVRLLGRGASSVVSLHRHRASGRLVAIKSISSQGSEAERKVVVREVTALQRVAHPHVVGFHGGFLRDGGFCFALEYMDAGCLLDLYQAVGSLRDDRVLAAVAKQVLLALRYLHKDRKVMHRDLKPTNLLLNRSGVVKVADFGMSAPLARTTDAKRTWVGTVTYMSPERISGEPYTASADMWSLGICLVECALGRYPYPLSTGNFWEIMDQVVSQPAPELPRDVFSPAFLDFIDRCLQKDPLHRPSSSAMLTHPLITQYDGEDEWETALLASFLDHPRVRGPLQETVEVRESFESRVTDESPESGGGYWGAAAHSAEQ